MKLGRHQEKWVKALESGDYKQGKGCLAQYSKDGKLRFCCLGVACEISKLSKWESSNELSMTYAGAHGGLPGPVMEWLGIRDETGSLVNDEGEYIHTKNADCLSSMNDSGWSFKKIAKFIRWNAELIFEESK